MPLARLNTLIRPQLPATSSEFISESTANLPTALVSACSLPIHPIKDPGPNPELPQAVGQVQRETTPLHQPPPVIEPTEPPLNPVDLVGPKRALPEPNSRQGSESPRKRVNLGNTIHLPQTDSDDEIPQIV
ncbi:hypothetical protein L0F63_006587 [Massospora cicadina]|nr:hypothetical protein L0F63_006587 [Massospora cicadina]